MYVKAAAYPMWIVDVDVLYEEHGLLWCACSQVVGYLDGSVEPSRAQYDLPRNQCDSE